MTDITIPADAAATIAWELRARAKHHRGALDAGDLTRLADLLDPPPSLRDEVAGVVQCYDQGYNTDLVVTDVLAVVRRHVEALPFSRNFGSDGVEWVKRDDVLNLFK